MSLDSSAERLGDSADGGAAPAWRPADARPSASAAAIHTVELTKHYRRTAALRGLSMTVGRGEVVGFLGPNGAGKTTTVKLLLGLARPTAGEALVLGAPAGDRETRRRIGYLPELFRFQGWLTAAEVLELHCQLLGLPRSTRAELVDDALQAVSLGGRAGDKVATFSKGMQQRLGLSVALLGAPELVVLDEPTSALDPLGRHDVREVIRSLRARGTTVFLNTHLLEEAEQLCDRVVVIDHGRVVASGSLADLLQPRSKVRWRVTGLGDRWWTGLTAWGRWQREGEWVTLAGVDTHQIPDVVAAVVARGGRVEAVVPDHQRLEDRFLEILGDR